MKIFSPVLKGTTTVSDGTTNLSGSFSGSFTGTATTASLAITSSYVLASSVDAQQTSRLNTLESVTGSFTLTSSFSSYTASNDSTNTTQNSRILSNEQKTGSFATTGSNYFIGTQVVTGSVFISSDLVVQGSSSLQNITASAVSVGTNTIILNTATPILQFGGISVQDSGSTMGRSGSLLWNSINDHWINVNPSGSDEGYNSAMVINGPKNVGSLGNEVGLTTSYVPRSQGEDHIEDSNIYSSGSLVGINTNSPQSQFVVGGTANSASVEINLFNSGYGRIFAYNRFNSTSANLILNDPGGNVGIGVTNPVAKLSVSNGGAETLEFAPAVSAANNRILSYNRSTSVYNGLTLDGETLFFKTSDSERMRITNGGNVGIGITNPASKLVVYGATQDAIQTILTLGGQNASSQAKELYFRLTAGGTPAWTFQTAAVGTDTNINIFPNGTAGLTIAYAGAATFSSSVTATGLINANSAASAANGSINIENTDPTLRFRVTSGSANKRIYEWRAVAAGGVNDIMQLRLWNDAESSASTLFSVASTGAATFSSSVGIGGPSLGDILHIMQNGTTSYAAMRVTNTSSTADIYVGIGGSEVANTPLRNNAYIMNAAASGLAFGTSDAVRMFITSAGNVGIGSTAPTSRLTVIAAAGAGALRVEGVTGQNAISLGGVGAFSIDYPGVANGRFLVRDDGLVAFPRIQDFTTGNSPNTWINPNASFGIYINTSSIRYKRDVVDYDKGLDILNQIRPVYYKGTSEVDGDKQFAGFIAEEIDELGLTEFVNYLEDGRPNSLSYPNMLTIAVKAIQELKAEVDTLRAQIS